MQSANGRVRAASRRAASLKRQVHSSAPKRYDPVTQLAAQTCGIPYGAVLLPGQETMRWPATEWVMTELCPPVLDPTERKGDRFASVTPSRSGGRVIESSGYREENELERFADR